MAGESKNAASTAFVIMSLIGDIFDMTEKVYEALDKVVMYDSDETVAVLGRYTYSGQAMKDFHDKLNYAAMVADYGLMETFATFLCTTPCLQSASINLGSRGSLSLAAQSLTMPQLESNTEAETPTLAVQEGVYKAKVVLASGELLALGVKIGFGAKQLAVGQTDQTDAL
jgi:hypothetical protein